MWPFKRKPSPKRERWALDEPIIKLSEGEPFTIEDACKGVQVWGMTGSGKTSGSGKFLALHYLKQGFGGLVLCAKPGEAATWRDYARKTGREDDLILFSASPSSPFQFNFLNFELHHSSEGAGLTENILFLFDSIAEVMNRTGGSRGGSEDGYWKKSQNQLTRNAIDLCVFATGSITVSDLYQIVISAPTSLEEAKKESWQSGSACFRALKLADSRSLTPYQRHDLAIVADYFLLEFPALAEKTRSIIMSTFTTMIDVLNRGILRPLFCTETTVTPADALNGKIIVVDLPVKSFAEIGTIAATIWKTQFQREVERRDVTQNPRPVFLFADESHLFTTKFDALFQSTARSSRCATVYLTQNINNYYSAYGGSSEGGRGRSDALSLLGNLTHHIVHALADSETATFMADLCGRSKQLMMNGSHSPEPYHPVDDLLGFGSNRTSSGFSEHIEHRVQPSDLFSLKPGGPPACEVEALIWRGGRPFRSTGLNHLFTSFPQGYPAWTKPFIQAAAKRPR